jgi:hypothetical protein
MFLYAHGAVTDLEGLAVLKLPACAESDRASALMGRPGWSFMWML